MMDWSQLHKDLLNEISKRIDTNCDYIRFRAVCGSWRSALPKSPQHLPCQIPWLMLPCKDHNTQRGFFSLSRTHVHELELSKARGKYCCGSSQGWLIFIDNIGAISLLNPLTRDKIQLPQMREEHLSSYVDDTENIADFYIEKVILAEKPTSDNYTAMAICGKNKKLAFCGSGDHKWTLIEGCARNSYEDIVYHKGQFYGMACDGGVVVCNIVDTKPKATMIKSREIFCCSGDKKYLVESSGGLNAVIRHKGYSRKKVRGKWRHFYETLAFSVWRLEPEYKIWKKVTDLDDSTMFVGLSDSLSLSAEGNFRGCKANCIYFTDDHWEDSIKEGVGGHDQGIYDLRSRTITKLPHHGKKSRSTWNSPPSVWVTPSLC